MRQLGAAPFGNFCYEVMTNHSEFNSGGV